jgi:hypothetical protein
MIYTIYKISIAGEDYIGSTRDLKQRKREHKSNCYNPKYKAYNCKFYTTIRNNGGWDCCEITPVEEFECETRRQAECREEHWRREYKALLNSQQAYTSVEERTNNQKKYSYSRKEQPYIICDCGSKYQIGNKGQHLKTKRHQEFISSNSVSVE